MNRAKVALGSSSIANESNKVVYKINQNIYAPSFFNLKTNINWIYTPLHPSSQTPLFQIV